MKDGMFHDEKSIISEHYGFTDVLVLPPGGDENSKHKVLEAFRRQEEKAAAFILGIAYDYQTGMPLE